MIIDTFKKVPWQVDTSLSKTGVAPVFSTTVCTGIRVPGTSFRTHHLLRKDTVKIFRRKKLKVYYTVTDIQQAMDNC